MGGTLKFFASLFFIAGVILCGIGFYKKDFYSYYKSYSYSSSNYVNAYVGNDADNYIINASYFAGYVSLGGSLLVLGGLFSIGGCIVGAIEKKVETKQ